MTVDEPTNPDPDTEKIITTGQDLAAAVRDLAARTELADGFEGRVKTAEDRSSSAQTRASTLLVLFVIDVIMTLVLIGFGIAGHNTQQHAAQNSRRLEVNSHRLEAVTDRLDAQQRVISAQQAQLDKVQQRAHTAQCNLYGLFLASYDPTSPEARRNPQRYEQAFAVIRADYRNLDCAPARSRPKGQ